MVIITMEWVVIFRLLFCFFQVDTLLFFIYCWLISRLLVCFLHVDTLLFFICCVLISRLLFRFPPCRYAAVPKIPCTDVADHLNIFLKSGSISNREARNTFKYNETTSYYTSFGTSITKLISEVNGVHRLRAQADNAHSFIVSPTYRPKEHHILEPNPSRM